MRVHGVCTTSDLVDVASVEEGKKVIVELFRRDYPDLDPTIEYATAYYCLEDDDGNCVCYLTRE